MDEHLSSEEARRWWAEYELVTVSQFPGLHKLARSRGVISCENEKFFRNIYTAEHEIFWSNKFNIQPLSSCLLI